MGIPGLWKILEPTSRKISLMELSVQEGFVENRHGTRTVVVGVDASPMIYAVQAVFAGPQRSHAQAGQNPELRALFFRLAWLSRSGVSAVFVFDGPNRPKKKRDKQVRTTPHWMTGKFQELVMGFGFHCHTAPGEAEAELAYLNASQAIDVVLTSDSDIFLFGANQILRNPVDSQHLDNISVFTADQLRKEHSNLFTVAGFVFMAIVSGGDYDTVGLPNCGSAISSALANSPLASKLYKAGKSMTENELHDFLVTWRVSLQQELINDPDGRLGRRYRSLAENMPSTFPDPKVVKQYCCPIISACVPHDAVNWFIPKIPNTAALADLCKCLFDWGPNIIDRFISNVWDGYLIRKVIKDFHNGFSIPNRAPSLANPTFNGVQKISTTKSDSSESYFYHVLVWIPSLTAEAAAAVLGSRNTQPNGVVHGLASTHNHSMTVKIPAPIFQITNPDLIDTYHNTHPRINRPPPAAPSSYSPVLEEFYFMA